MGPHCCCDGCNERYEKGRPYTFHNFPKDEQRTKLWLQKINRNDFVPTSYSKVCSKHFTKDCFYRHKNGAIWLKSNAVPTVFDFPKMQKKDKGERKRPAKRKTRVSKYGVKASSQDNNELLESIQRKFVPILPAPDTTANRVWCILVPVVPKPGEIRPGVERAGNGTTTGGETNNEESDSASDRMPACHTVNLQEAFADTFVKEEPAGDGDESVCSAPEGDCENSLVEEESREDHDTSAFSTTKEVRSNRDSTSRQGRCISTEQRELMLDFMIKHRTLGTGRLTGPDGAKHKQMLLKELTAVLNGVTNSEDKWLKSWQYWRNNVELKACVLRKKMKKTGGGTSSTVKPMTPLEEKFLHFLGLRVVSGHEEVPDPLTVARQDSGRGGLTQTDREGEGPVEVNEYVHNIGSNQDLITLPLDGSNTISGHVQTPLISPPLALAEESVQSASGCVPALHESQLCPSTSAKKRRRSVGCTSSQDEDPLVAMAREQLTCMRDQNDLRRERNSIVCAQLQVEKRKAVVIERAAEVFVGAMNALEEYLRHRRENE